MQTLSEWRAGLLGQWSRCPWPGPRPLSTTQDDSSRFAVRDVRDLPEIVDDVLAHKLVILAGESGVGKSSLVAVGLPEALKMADYEVLILSDWSTPVDDSDEDLDPAALYVYHGLKNKYEAEAEWNAKGRRFKDTTPAGLLSFFEEKVGKGRLVLVLDQFEELIRYKEDLFESVVDWILEANRSRDIHLVLSLRSEYAHKLRRLEAEARPFSVTKYVLEPLQAVDEIREVITKSADATKRRGSTSVTPDAVELIVERWRELGRDADQLDDPLDRRIEPRVRAPSSIGLLHVQALMFELYFRVEESKGQRTARSVIDEDAVTTYFDRCDEAFHGAGTPHDVTAQARAVYTFRTALKDAINRKLSQCEEQYTGSRPGSVSVEESLPLVVGTKSMVRRIVPHLSSGGYKQVQDKWDLARLVLDTELRALGLGTSEQLEELRETFDHMSQVAAGADSGCDLLTSHREALVPDTIVDKSALLGMEPDQQLSMRKGDVYLGQAGLGPTPWIVDPRERSAGVMLGQSPWAVMVEEMRRFLFAVEWLERSDLIRPTMIGQRQTMLSLIHDGFSEALVEWSSVTGEPAETAVHRLTVAIGEEFEWSSDHVPLDSEAFTGTDGRRRTFVNLRWQYCRITADFVRVTFVNCDFRGTLFVNCRFEGVSFVNCLLDECSFERCVIAGAPRTGRGGTKGPVDSPLGADIGVKRDDEKVRPRFRVRVAPQVLQTLADYRGDVLAADEKSATRKTGGSGWRGDEWSQDPAVMSITSGVPARPALPGEEPNGRWQPLDGDLTLFGGRLNSMTIRQCEFARLGSIRLCEISGTSLDLVEQQHANLEFRTTLIRGLTITSSITNPVEPTRRAGTVNISAKNTVFESVWLGQGLRGDATFDELCVVWQLTNMSPGVKLVTPKNAEGLTALFHGVERVGAEADSTNGDSARGRAEALVVELARSIDYRSTPARVEIEGGIG